MRSNTVLLAALLLGLAPAALATTIYRWQDADGVWQITTTPPPPGSRAVTMTRAADVPRERARSAPAAPADESPVRAPPSVVMYATKRCPWCRKAREYLTRRGIAWQEIDIESSAFAERDFKQRGGQGVPLIFVGDERIAGWSPDSLDAALARAGLGR